MSKKLKDTDPKTAKDLKFFELKIIIGTLAELLCVLISVLLFIKTQYIHGNITVMDDNTLIFIAIFAAALSADIIFFRYRGQHPKEDEENQ